MKSTDRQVDSKTCAEVGPDVTSMLWLATNIREPQAVGKCLALIRRFRPEVSITPLHFDRFLMLGDHSRMLVTSHLP